jgi:hypothetical protein
VIDWPFVATHALWILGLAVILAAFSYHNWLRQELGRSFRTQWREPGWRVPHYAGLILIAVSMVLMAGAPVWERAVWAVLAMVWSRQAYAAWQIWSGSPAAKPQHSANGTEHDPEIEQ